VKRQRIPDTRAGRTLLLLPGIPDDLEPRLKNALAIRNTASTTGTCPDCGTTPQLYRDTQYDGVMHMVFQHERHCRALTDGTAA
jgi:hypothetical protein